VVRPVHPEETIAGRLCEVHCKIMGEAFHQQIERAQPFSYSATVWRTATSSKTLGPRRGTRPDVSLLTQTFWVEPP
jgi:hypothetical protein